MESKASVKRIQYYTTTAMSRETVGGTATVMATATDHRIPGLLISFHAGVSSTKLIHSQWRARHRSPGGPQVRDVKEARSYPRSSFRCNTYPRKGANVPRITADLPLIYAFHRYAAKASNLRSKLLRNILIFYTTYVIFSQCLLIFFSDFHRTC
jgi:hypothetical protein